MARKGWTLGIIALASLALLVVVAALAASPAGATITGKQVPTYGNDWVIDQDTNVLGETILLQGDIVIDPGYTLKIRNSQITFNSSSFGEHGIFVDTDGTLELEDTSIKSDYAFYGWYFEIEGTTKITNNVRLNHVQDGIYINSDNVSIDDLELNAQGWYGLYIDSADPTVTNSDINLKAYPGSYATGIRLWGSSSDRSAPTFDNVNVRLTCNEKFEYAGSYYYTYFYLTGFDAYYADLGTLKNIDISFDVTSDAMFNYTGSPTYYVYFYVNGLRLDGGTYLDGFQNVEISNSTYFIDVDAEGTTSGRMYLRNYMNFIQNYIGSDGSSPDTLSGISVKNQLVTYDDNGIFTNVYKYYYGYGLYWWPSSSAMGTTLTVDGIVFDGVEIEDMIRLIDSVELVLQNNMWMNSYIDDYFWEMRYFNNDVTIQDNVIYNCSMSGDYYFYIYRPNAGVEFSGNNITENKIYRFARIYYSYETITFEDNLWMKNGLSTRGSGYYFIEFYGIQEDVLFKDNRLINNSFRYMMYLNYNSGGNIDIMNNRIDGNIGSDYLIYTNDLRNPVNFEENSLFNNSLNGVFYIRYLRTVLTIDQNLIEANSLGAKGFIFEYGYSYSGGYWVTDNEFIDNTGSGKYFEFFGLGYWGKLSFTFERNIFINNTATTATNGGLVFFYKIRQSITITNNEFINNSASCIVFHIPYRYGYYYYSPENHWFIVEDNSFYNNTGKGIVFSEVDNNHIQIMGNKGAGNKDYVVWVSQSDDKQYNYGDSGHAYIYCYYNAQGPDTLIVEANNFSYNPGGGMWLRTSQTDSSPSTYYPYGNPDQLVRVKKNMLYGNGPDGWSLAITGLFSKPSVKNNRLEGSSMGMFWGLIQGDERRTEFNIEIRDVEIDGGPDGMTAYGFQDVDASIYDSVFVNFDEAFYAEDCELNVYWSTVPEASGKTEGKGRIYIWNHLEMLVTWANATGVDSDVPVDTATIAMRGANGNYQAYNTDENGKLPMMVINPWTCIDGVMNAWSPYQVSIMANEVSTVHTMHVVGDFIDPNPMRLTLNDIFVPEVIISNPQDGTLVNTADVLGEGFLFEIGSGITVFEGRTDEMPEDEWLPLTQGVLWQNVFEGMTEGEHNVSVRAADLSGNWNTSTVSIVVDLTNPALDVHLEFLDTRLIEYNETMGGFFVRDKEIAINGTYSDNFADLRSIIIRVNGVPEYIFDSQLGKIYMRVKLDQGINTLIVDATDTAGNRMTVKLYVSLDSYAPTLYIYEPLQNEKTANATMLVTGLTEPNTRLDLIVQASAGTNTYTTMSGDDGNFEFPVDLFEGIQKVLVTAVDSANNPTQLFRDIVLDTTAPDFVINQPPKDYVITKETRFNIVGTMTFEPDADVYIWGQWVQNPGVFSREVVLQEGENVIDIVAIDKVGNEKVTYVTVVRDTVKPVLEVLSPEGDFLLTRETTVHFEGTVAGAQGVTIEHKSIPLDATITEGDWDLGGNWEYDLELGPQDLDQYIVVRAFDEAENEVMVTIHIILDIVKPRLQMSDFPDEVDSPFLWINGTTDANILTVAVQGVEFPVTDGEFGVRWSLAAGANSIDVMVTDEAGNEASEVVSVTYNYKPPKQVGTGGEDEGLSNIWGIALIIAAITVVATVFLVTRQRKGRR
jgi:hypothetical protein